MPGSATLGPGDVFEARVYGEPELSGAYRVGPHGDIVFPLCRRVTVGGLTANATAEKLRACLSDEPVADWRRRWIGKPFDGPAFVQMVEEWVPELRAARPPEQVDLGAEAAAV